MDGARLVETTQDPLIGRTIERYRVERVLGSGGMATVYQVHHVYLDKPFAMKVLHGEIASDASLAKRFQREAKALSRIHHPNVVSVVDFGVSERGLLFMVMELLRGHTVSDLVRNGVRLSPDRARRLVCQMALALEAAHREGFIHRDLKPSNVMVVETEAGESIRLMDFGLVRVLDGQDGFSGPQLTLVGQFFGTPAYMAPEQVMGNDTSAATDLYALGVILYQLLEGDTPFTGDLKTLSYRHVHDAPPPLSEPYGGLAELTLRLLNKQPEDRPASAAQLAAQLEALGPLSTTAPVAGGAPPRMPPPRSGSQRSGSLPFRPDSSARAAPPRAGSRPGSFAQASVATGPRISGLPEATGADDGPQVVIDPSLDGSGPRSRPPKKPRTALWVLLLLIIGGGVGVFFAQSQEPKISPVPEGPRALTGEAVSQPSEAPAPPPKAAERELPPPMPEPIEAPKVAKKVKKKRLSKRERLRARRAAKAKAKRERLKAAKAKAAKAKAAKAKAEAKPAKPKAEEKPAKAEEKPAEAEETPTEAEETPAEEAPAEETPAEEAPAEEAPAEEAAPAPKATEEASSQPEIQKLHKRLKRVLAKRGLRYKDLAEAKPKQAKNWLRWVSESGDPPAPLLKAAFEELMAAAKALPSESLKRLEDPHIGRDTAEQRQREQERLGEARLAHEREAGAEQQPQQELHVKEAHRHRDAQLRHQAKAADQDQQEPEPVEDARAAVAPGPAPHRPADAGADPEEQDHDPKDVEEGVYGG